MTVIQALTQTPRIVGSRTSLPDKLREKRNLSGHFGTGVDEVSFDTSLRQSTRLPQEVRSWLKRDHPELL